MDLETQVSLVPRTAEPSPSDEKSVGASRMSLFDAVRRWTDDEAVSFDIEDGARRLTAEEIQEVAHSEAYKARLLAFDERI
jgi:hypothetical protein